MKPEHPLYRTWRNMLNRCRLPSFPDYKYYGARGITVCDAWLDFETFVRDVGERPTGKTLDRIDNNGPYAPGNWKWSTQREQVLNSRRVVMLTKDGVTQCLSDWAAQMGLTQPAISNRIRRRGIERALT
jgi:hypothetical protein